MLAQKIYEGKRLKLAGFAVGDGVLGHGDTAGGPQFTIDFFYGHAQFSAKTYNQIVAACPLEARAAGGAALASSGPNCSTAMAKMSKEIGGYCATR
eukprot:SAG22_NODE_9647_length_577_cov_0.970711_1_plen_96_part_00